jgi:hypothetical protein
MIYQYPLAWPVGWPRTKYQDYGQFKVDYDQAVRDLAYELGSRQVVWPHCRHLVGPPWVAGLLSWWVRRHLVWPHSVGGLGRVSQRLVWAGQRGAVGRSLTGVP